MFDIGWGELMLIGIVALIAIGPKELPGTLRTLGQWMAKVRRMAAEFQNQFQEAMREAELAELRKEVDEMADKAASYTHFDPIGDITKDMEKAADLPELDAPVTPSSPPPLPGPQPEARLEPPADDATHPEAIHPEAMLPAPAEPTLLPAPEPSENPGKPDAGKAA